MAAARGIIRGTASGRPLDQEAIYTTALEVLKT